MMMYIHGISYAQGPTLPDQVWVAHVTEFDIETGLLTGVFHYNASSSITAKLDMFVEDSVIITNDNIMFMYSDVNDLELSEMSISNIEGYVKKAMS